MSEDMPVFRSTLDLSAIDAIDVHTHIEIDSHGHLSIDDTLVEASAKYFKAGTDRTPTIDALAAHYRERRRAAVVFTVDSSTATGHPAISSEEVAEGAARNSDVLIPFGSVDPHHGRTAITTAVRLVEQYGVRGFKFHPSLQGFSPNDTQWYPLYQAISDLGVPALFHTGQTGIGAGLPGGHGIKLRLSDPMLLDDVAADFPDLTLIMAHPSVPWQDSAISIATHKANVYIDLSGWLPKYFPPQLVRAVNTMLKHKVLFGTDYPVIDPDRWMLEFDKLDIKDEVRPLVLKENAVKVLGLSG